MIIGLERNRNDPLNPLYQSQSFVQYNRRASGPGETASRLKLVSFPDPAFTKDKAGSGNETTLKPVAVLK